MNSALWPLVGGGGGTCHSAESSSSPRFMRVIAFLNISLLKMLVISFWVAGSREQGLTTVLTGAPSTWGEKACLGRSR